MKLHICTEDPCPKLDEELAQVLVDGCKTTYTKIAGENLIPGAVYVAEGGKVYQSIKQTP